MVGTIIIIIIIIIIIALQPTAEGLLQSEAAWWNEENYNNYREMIIIIIELVVQFDWVMTQLRKAGFGLWEAGWTLTAVKVGATVFRIELCHKLFPEEFC